jgi:glycine cleavage system regulatory protein
MAQLVLTVLGDDRPGIVQSLAHTVAAYGGNWQRSELAELAGAFAGIVLVEVADDAVDALTTALADLPALRVLVHLTTHAPDPAGSRLTFTVLGNDRPGIVNDVTRALSVRGLTIDAFTSRVFDAPMAGGTLFEASIAAHAASAAVADDATAALEQLAGEIQVDLTFDAS